MNSCLEPPRSTVSRSRRAAWFKETGLEQVGRVGSETALPSTTARQKCMTVKVMLVGWSDFV